MTAGGEPLEPLAPTPVFLEACEAYGLDLDEGTLRKLGLFLALLLERNKRFNLTGIKDPEVAWMRHVFDSLTLLPFAQAAESLLDLGSGGGPPGVPLAICAPELSVSLVEATNKKCVFLREARRALDLDNCEVRWGRAEELGRAKDLRERYDIACARGVARLPTLLEYLLPFVRVGGMALAMKGRGHAQELREAKQALKTLGGELAEAHVLEEDGDLVVLEIHKVKRLSPKYPRALGIPKKTPI